MPISHPFLLIPFSTKARPGGFVEVLVVVLAVLSELVLVVSAVLSEAS